jgi:hypothetical protein
VPESNLSLMETMCALDADIEVVHGCESSHMQRAHSALAWAARKGKVLHCLKLAGNMSDAMLHSPFT